ncbi:MAG: hypothetical protein IIB09_05175, partial [Bacteroidetes bacterium]|nr:hypothetical protein [Bacteroidota bacterium]
MIDLYLMKRPFLWIPLFAVAAFSFACDSAGEVSSALDPGTFEATITGGVETELMGTAIVTIDAFGGEPELYDLAADPHERNNIAEAESVRVAALQSRMTGFFGEDLSQAATAEPTHHLGAE